MLRLPGLIALRAERAGVVRLQKGASPVIRDCYARSSSAVSSTTSPIVRQCKQAGRVYGRSLYVGAPQVEADVDRNATLLRFYVDAVNARPAKLFPYVESSPTENKVLTWFIHQTSAVHFNALQRVSSYPNSFDGWPIRSVSSSAPLRDLFENVRYRITRS